MQLVHLMNFFFFTSKLYLVRKNLPTPLDFAVDNFHLDKMQFRRVQQCTCTIPIVWFGWFLSLAFQLALHASPLAFLIFRWAAISFSVTKENEELPVTGAFGVLSLPTLTLEDVISIFISRLNNMFLLQSNLIACFWVVN